MAWGEELESGTLLDRRYRIEELVGAGGHAEVYRALHVHLNREVAVKMLAVELVQDARLVSRFLQEARIAAEFDHPNLVTVFDYGLYTLDSGVMQPFMVMSLLKGHSLDKVLEAGGKMSPKRAVRLLIEVLGALQQGHERGIVHKDLKPENLFLIEEQRRERLMVTDFGVARRLTASSHHSGEKTITGTPQYLAPEYIQNSLVLPAFDVYQIGLVLAEMIQGFTAVTGRSPYECMLKHCRGELELSEDVRDSPYFPMIERATKLDPDERYPDAGSFAQALLFALARASDQLAQVQISNVLTREAEREGESPPIEVLFERGESLKEPVPLDALRGLIDGAPRVLVVDDDPITRELIVFILDSVGVETLEAKNGHEGVLRAFTHQPNLIILDRVMPGMDGLEALKRLREDPATYTIPVLMVTGRATLDERIEGLRIGADDYLGKPFEPSELLTRVGALLLRQSRASTLDPLSKLPGKSAIALEVQSWLQHDQAFTLAYVRLRGLEERVAKQGFQDAHGLVRRCSQILYACVQELGGRDDFLGHVTPDRFFLLLAPASSTKLCQTLAERFDALGEARVWLDIAKIDVEPLRTRKLRDFLKQVQDCLEKLGGNASEQSRVHPFRV